MQRVAVQARRVVNEQPPFREEDALALFDRDQPQLASERACAHLEQVRPIDAGEEAEPLHDAPLPVGASTQNPSSDRCFR